MLWEEGGRELAPRMRWLPMTEGEEMEEDEKDEEDVEDEEEGEESPTRQRAKASAAMEPLRES